MANELVYPLINGNRYTWSSIKINVGAQQYEGVKSINFNEKVDRQKIHGTGQNIIGAGAGMYDADGDLEVYQQEADAIVDSLGNGWGNKTLTITVQYIDDMQPTRTKILTCSLSGRTQGGSEGNEVLTSKFTLFFLAPISDNGITMVPPIVATVLV